MTRHLPLPLWLLAAACALVSGCVAIAPPPMSTVAPNTVGADISFGGGPTHFSGDEGDFTDGQVFVAAAFRGRDEQVEISGGTSLSVLAGDYTAEQHSPVLLGNAGFLRIGTRGSHWFLGGQMEAGLLPLFAAIGVVPGVKLGPVQAWGQAGVAIYGIPIVDIFGDNDEFRAERYFRSSAGLAVDVTDKVGVFALGDALFRPWGPNPNLNSAPPDILQVVLGVQIRVYTRNVQNQSTTSAPSGSSK